MILVLFLATVAHVVFLFVGFGSVLNRREGTVAPAFSSERRRLKEIVAVTVSVRRAQFDGADGGRLQISGDFLSSENSSAHLLRLSGTPIDASESLPRS